MALTPELLLLHATGLMVTARLLDARPTMPERG